MAPNPMVLPLGIATRGDTSRLMREAESLEDLMRQASIRNPNAAPVLPQISPLLEEAASLNKLNLLQAADRSSLVQFLQEVREKAPVLHMSFSSVASPLFKERLINWLRTEIHPLILIQVGLQPAIGAGCVVRTTNKYFDFSLKQRFAKKREQLIASLHSAGQLPPKNPTPASGQEAAA